MQKKVLAAVIGSMLVAPAVFADSANVIISGRFSVGFEQYKVGAGKSAAPAAGGYHNEQKVSDQSSRLILSGSEDLGGGLKAVFQLDNRFAADLGGNAAATSNGFANGNTGAGLAGSFGQVMLGRWDVHYNELLPIGVGRAGSLQSILSMGPMSQVAGSNIANGTRTNNLIKWDSNNMGGVTATVAYSTAPFAAEGTGVGSDGSKGDAITGAIRWSSGPLVLGASYWDASPEGAISNPAGEEKSTRAWAGYTLDAFKFGFAVDSSEKRIGTAGTSVGTFSKRTAFMVPVTFTFGTNQLHLHYVSVGDLDTGGKVANSGANSLMLGWDTALSKRTNVGVYYSEMKNDANAAYRLFASGTTPALGNGETQKQLYFGYAHSF